MTAIATPPVPATTDHLYERLQERIVGRDQVGTSEVFYDLVKAGRPITEMLRETVRIQSPYTHVPYHQRIDNGVARFVNNDHSLLSARATLRLTPLMPPEDRYLPLAQTMWYVPTGLDPWNQLLGKLPGHYGRRNFVPDAPTNLEMPQVHWEDQAPLYLEGSIDERLNQWLTAVQRGEVIPAYRMFLGLMEEEQHRKKVLAHLVFAGLIDVQDRMLFNRSYTTGHKAYRARATVELGTAVGWENAHHVLYAGVPDIAVGPRWYSAYEMAGEVVWWKLAQPEELPLSSLDKTPELLPERRFFDSTSEVSPAESDMLVHALLNAPEPAYIEALVALLAGGRSPRSIVDVLQVAAAKTVLQTQDMRNFAMPQHCSEYMNTLRWFYDTFDHEHRIKLLFVAGSFICQTAHWLRSEPGNGTRVIRAPRGSDALSGQEILDNLDEAMLKLDPAAATAWVQAYINSGNDKEPLLRVLALGATKQGNDPHNQELGLCYVEDYRHNRSKDRDQLLLACAQHTAGHMKYGDVLEPYRRLRDGLGANFEITANTQGSAEPIEALLD